MFKKSKEKTIVTEADRLASKKEELDALSWERVAEIAKHLQEGTSEDEIKELSRELLSIARANTSLLEKFGVTSDSLTGKIMPSGIELVEKEPAAEEQKPASFSSLRDAVLGEKSQKSSPLSEIVAGETGSGMPDITKDVSDFFAAAEEERTEKTPFIPRGDEAIRQSIQSKLATMPPNTSVEEKSAEMPDISQEDVAESKSEDAHELSRVTPLVEDEKAQNSDSDNDIEPQVEVETELKTELEALKPALVTIVGSAPKDDAGEKDAVESELESEKDSEPVHDFNFGLKSLFMEKAEFEEVPIAERETEQEHEFESKLEQASVTSEFAASEPDSGQLLEAEIQKESAPSPEIEPEFKEEPEPESEDKLELEDESKLEDELELSVDRKDISKDAQLSEAADEQRSELEEEQLNLPLEYVSESLKEQLPTIEELPAVKEETHISEILKNPSASHDVNEQVDLTPEIILSVVEQGDIDIEPEILQALIQEVSQEKEVKSEVPDVVSDITEFAEEPSEEVPTSFGSSEKDSADGLLQAAEPKQEDAFESQQDAAVAPEPAQSEDVKPDQLPIQEQTEEQSKGRSLFGFGQLFQQPKQTEPAPSAPVEQASSQPESEAQAPATEENKSKRRRKTTKQDLANFKLIYSSRDGALSLYRDADGHVVAVDNSKLE